MSVYRRWRCVVVFFQPEHGKATNRKRRAFCGLGRGRRIWLKWVRKLLWRIGRLSRGWCLLKRFKSGSYYLNEKSLGIHGNIIVSLLNNIVRWTHHEQKKLTYYFIFNKRLSTYSVSLIGKLTIYFITNVLIKWKHFFSNNDIIYLKVLLLLKIHILWSINAIIYFRSVQNYEIKAMRIFSHKINWKIANISTRKVLYRYNECQHNPYLLKSIDFHNWQDQVQSQPYFIIKNTCHIHH